MRLATDSRARVPFALVAVVLLVSSATFVAALERRAPDAVDSRVEDAAEEAKTVARTALGVAAENAVRGAAANPLLEPANTTYGRAVNDTTPFMDGLRIRLYLEARESLTRVRPSIDGVHARATFPPITDAESLREAKRRVEVTPLDDGQRLRVRFRNLSVAVSRGGQVVDRERYAPSVVVRSPLLALHRNVSTYERRLNAGPMQPGLGRRMTARLYAMAWTRGYAQYGGAPISNVVANRHVELATNGGVLGVQRTVFGRANPEARSALTHAAVRAGSEDLVSGLETAVDRQVDPVERHAAGPSGAVDRPATAGDLTPRGFDDTVTVGVNRSADRAFLRLLDGADGEPSLSSVLDSVYSADVHLASRVRTVDRRTTRDGRAPGGWRLIGRTRTVEVDVRDSDGPSPIPPPGYHRLDSFTKTVEVTTRVHRRWADDGAVRTTTTERTIVDRVGIAVVGRHAATPYAPRRGVQDAHRPGGPLDGQNFAGVRDRAVHRLVTSRGGPDALARQAVRGNLDTDPVSLSIPQPDGLHAWVYEDVAALRESVRNRSVDVDRGDLLDADPPADLAASIESNNTSLAGVPATYGSVAGKARVAARSAYLDALRNHLRERSRRGQSVRSSVDGVLADRGVSGVYRNASSILGTTTHEEATDTRTAVSTEPTHLTLSGSPAGRNGSTTYPLVARNLNMFTLPYEDAADAVIGTVLDRPDDRVTLRTAASALRSANRTLAHRDNATLRPRRDRLQGDVSSSLDDVRDELGATLRREAPWLPASERRRALDAGFSRWSTIHDRALAAANGSLSESVARAAVRGATSPGTPPNGTAEDRVRVRLRVALNDVTRMSAATTPRRPVERTVNATQTFARAELESHVADVLRDGGDALLERRLGEGVVAVPAGLPVTPVPGYWYATLNVWGVEVRGRYDRLAASAPAGSPAPDSNLTYVRRADGVALDVDDDGDAELVGRNRPVSFAVETAVMVVVPPGGDGVGDVSGSADERSPGWPRPGSSDNAFATRFEKRGMLLEVFDPETVTAAELRERYEAGLTSVVESVGVVAAADVTGIESERLDALRRGKGATLTVREASALLALSDEWPDEETLLLEVRDSLLLGMSAAVLDVETLASELDGDLSARELQRKIEGRTEMTLGEYATVTHRLAEKNPY